MRIKDYITAKDKICIRGGEDDPDTVTLRALRLEKEFPGLKVYICAVDEKVSQYGSERVFGESSLESKIAEFGFVEKKEISHMRYQKNKIIY